MAAAPPGSARRSGRRAGAKTLLLERYGFLGGAASWGMGMRVNQMTPEGQSRGLVHDLVIDKLKRMVWT